MSKVKDGNYIVIQSFMVTDLKLKGNELIIYAIIYGFSQAEGQKFSGGLQYLADWTNTSKQSVLNNLKSLIKKGLIIKNDKVLNGVKFVEYYSKNLNGVLKKFEYPIKKILPNNINNNIDDNKEIINNQFAELWALYPRKQGKKQAQAAFEKAIREGVKVKDIKQGIERYLRYIKENKIDSRYIKQGSTWFRNECWTDELNIRKPSSPSFDLDELERIE